ncbi:unnamed protein product [Triticum turgidum subsp. durum]|uniref:Uncharacterized protein n=1 Tax=Triticum turgidum subsp. durum TaxID=4567 RepID=A0A9R1AJB4_TRITD|nr:unnamed protein product [Triticum turgidum subsp. durum]
MMRTSRSSAWLQRCRMLLVRGEATFMDEEHWTVMICFTSKSKWRPRKMQSVFFAVQRSGHSLLLRAATLADSAPALPAALCVDARPKSDIRQRDLLKNIVGIKPKRPKVCSPRQAAENDGPKRNQEVSVSKMSSCQNEPKPAEATESRPQNVTGSLLGLAYESSDEE